MYYLLIIIFIIGYFAITLEHSFKINKAAIAILTGVLCWTVYILSAGTEQEAHHISESLSHHLASISEILFFLMGAMTIVELIDAHDGFEVVTSRINTLNKVRLLWIVSLLAFFLSAVLDNLTTAIVMVSLLRKLIADKNDRLFFAGMVVIAANAGGAWSPIGDVTTTMLWIGGQISSLSIMGKLIIPSLVCILVPLAVLSFALKGAIQKPELSEAERRISSTPAQRNIIFFTGLGALIFVPVFKTITHLPPYMGILFGLGVLWIVSELIHNQKDEEDKHSLSVVYALRKIDMPSVLFFLGILSAITALETAGHLTDLATFMDTNIGNQSVIVMSIGVLSAIVDNVPLVAAAMGMYSFPMDHYFWEFLAYCAGTGGSILIIGSAAGVAVMGMEKIDFFWYLKRISLLALLGYIAGALVYMGQEYLRS
ncbi:MAG: sodium:proton antiporter NhaD [Bacteroidota bacterium]